MTFNSLQFLFFFPIVILIYFILPMKKRYIWLLISSYYFYMCWNAKYILLIFFSTIVTYISGIFIESAKKESWSNKKCLFIKRIFVLLSFLLNLSVLFFFKYFDFVFNNINSVLIKFGVALHHSVFDVMLPVGISFYTFQALSYTMDVYRNEVHAERNLLKYALFVSFFPQLVAGPIERSKNLLKQINVPVKFNVQNARYGLFTMAYGLVLKMVVADRISLIIDPVLSEYNEYNGMVIVMSIVLFAFQIYCDFHGYTQIAIGSARILGIDLQQNFKSPYFAANIKEFWRNWHISLTSWFTDYLYIPLGGNRKGRLRKYVNTLFVFLCSGLWHGASWNYVAWGGLNGLYLVVYDIAKPLLDKGKAVLNIDTKAIGYKVISCIVTFFLVDYSWLYFRAGSLKNAIKMQTIIAHDFYLPYFLSNDLLAVYGDHSTLAILFFAFIFIFVTDFFHYKGIDWEQKILNQQIIYRWIIYFTILLVIFIFGVYGKGNEQTQFIYFQF